VSCYANGFTDAIPVVVTRIGLVTPVIPVGAVVVDSPSS
jgi:hypothetical protein